MRTEYEILELVKKIAGEDSRINAAALCGSRADKSVPRDVYQDYDILLCVSELAPFKNLFNEWYARDTSKKIRAVKRSNAISGVYNAAKVVYG